ncbi:MAG: HAD family phosphatase [Cyclobacteriaceae bacterium]|nr:HAD family phosphatase [Cyclobacteriaceae bacterium]
MIKQLIFDCDGVLVDSEILSAEVMVNVLGKHGIEITLAYYLQNCTGKTFTGLRTEFSNQFNVSLPDSFLEEVMVDMGVKTKNELKQIVGIHKVLEKSKLPKAVVSNSYLYQIEHAINHIKIAHHFDNQLFSSQMASKPKPDPAIYLLAAEKLGVQPKECLVVEDSISGATSALSAGMKVIGFVAGSHIIDGHKQKLLDLGVVSVAENSDELLEIITQYE